MTLAAKRRIRVTENSTRRARQNVQIVLRDNRIEQDNRSRRHREPRICRCRPAKTDIHDLSAGRRVAQPQHIAATDGRVQKLDRRRADHNRNIDQRSVTVILANVRGFTGHARDGVLLTDGKATPAAPHLIGGQVVRRRRQMRWRLPRFKRRREARRGKAGIARHVDQSENARTKTPAKPRSML